MSKYQCPRCGSCEMTITDGAIDEHWMPGGSVLEAINVLGPDDRVSNVEVFRVHKKCPWSGRQAVPS